MIKGSALQKHLEARYRSAAGFARGRPTVHIRARHNLSEITGRNAIHSLSRLELREEARKSQSSDRREMTDLQQASKVLQGAPFHLPASEWELRYLKRTGLTAAKT